MFKVAVGSCFAFAIGKTTDRVDNSIFDDGTTVNDSHQVSQVHSNINEGFDKRSENLNNVNVGNPNHNYQG